MTISEVCQLVLQAGFEKQRSAIVILDMGEPVKIMDIVNKMIEISGKEAENKVSGLCRGEKTRDDIRSVQEELEPSSHPRFGGSLHLNYAHQI